MTLTVEAKNLSLRFKRFEVLKNISFTLEDGKIYGLLGRNGAGKTSLLSLFASFREPSAGTLMINGEEPFENAKVMEMVSFIYEKDYKEETEKVKNMLKMVERYRPNFDGDYAKYLVKRFKLPLDRPVNKLSKGMQSSLNVIMGLAAKTPLTIFDEAYLGMDAPTREIFYKELLEEQSAHPRLFILSTHLVSEMDYLFDEVLIIHKGELLLQKNFEDLIASGATITGMVSDVDRFASGMNILRQQQLGRTKSVTIYGSLSETQLMKAKEMDLDVGPVSLQDLFIHLTGEEDQNEG